MKYVLLFFFIYCNSFGQNRPIEIKIDSITSVDTEFKRREFTIAFHIQNISDKEVSFFLNTKSFIPSIASSMQFVPTYRFYQNETAIDVSGIFTGEFTKVPAEIDNQKSMDEWMKRMKDSIKADSEKMRIDPDFLWKKKNKEIMNAVFILQPKEVRHFIKKINWDKERYRKSHDIEYYFDEKDAYFIEVELTLLKKEYEDRLTKEELAAIMDNPNFIRGNYKSNKVEINFKE